MRRGPRRVESLACAKRGSAGGLLEVMGKKLHRGPCPGTVAGAVEKSARRELTLVRLLIFSYQCCALGDAGTLKAVSGNYWSMRGMVGRNHER